jgi:hypothetical protein
MVSAADPYGRNLGSLDRTSLQHLHKALHYILGGYVKLNYILFRDKHLFNFF